MTSKADSFVAAIRARPGDHLPRLVFSDWLEEQGDDRFHWVRDADVFAHTGDDFHDPIPGLIEQLDSTFVEFEEDGEEELRTTANRRESIVRILARCGPLVVPALMSRFQDGPWYDEYETILVNYPEALAARIDQLTAAAAARDSLFPGRAHRLLVSAGEYDSDALKPFFTATKSWDWRESENAFAAGCKARGAAAEAIVHTWLPALERELEEPELDDPDLTVKRFECLRAMQHRTADVVPLLVRAIRHKNSELAQAAAGALAQFREHATTIIDEEFRNCSAGNNGAVIELARSIWPDWQERLMRMFENASLSREARLGILSSLKEYDREKWAAAAGLYAAALKHRDIEIRSAAVEALRESQGPGEAVLSLLREASRDPVVTVREKVFEILNDRSLPQNVLIPAVIAGLGDDSGIAWRAEEMAKRVPGTLDRVVGELKRRVTDPDPARRAQALVALARAGEVDSAITRLLLQGMDDRVPDVRRAAIHALDWVNGTHERAVRKRVRKALQDGDAGVRQRAALALASRDESAKEALPDLLELTHDPEPRARAGAFHAVSKIVVENPEVLKVLSRGLRDPHERVVIETLKGLGSVYNLPPAVQQCILGLADHPSPAIRNGVVSALQHIGEENPFAESVAALRKALRDPDATVRHAAFETIRFNKTIVAAARVELLEYFDDADCPDRTSIVNDLFENPEATPGFIRRLGVRDEEVRREALTAILYAFHRLPDHRTAIAEGAAPHLPRLLTTERGERLQKVLELVECLGTGAAKCYPQVRRLLDHSNWLIRRMARSAIGRLGPVALPIAPRLQDLLENESGPDDRAALASSLLSLGACEPSLLSEVFNLLHTDATEVRRAIIIRCGLHPEIGTKTVPHLVRAWNETTEWDQRAIPDSFANLGESVRPYIPRLTELLTKEPDALSRKRLVRGLGLLGPVASAAVPTLIRGVRLEADDNARQEIVEVLGMIPGPGRVAALAFALQDRDGWIRETAAIALGQIGKEAIEAIPAMCKALLDSKWDNYRAYRFANNPQDYPEGYGDFLYTTQGSDRRQHLLASLQKLKEDAAPAMPTLQKLLDDRNDTLARDAARTLACIGPSAIPILKKASRHRDEVIRETAEKALRDLEFS